MSDSVSCPACEQRHRDLWELDLEDGQSADIECDCGTTFRIVCSIRTTYRVEGRDQDE